MIEVQRLTRSYGDLKAVDDISFDIARSQIVGLLGHNGAGKTTVMKMLTGFLEPSAGDIRIDGLDIRERRREVQKRIGYLPENAPLYPELSVQAYLKMIANLRQIPADEQPQRLTEAIRATGLEHHLTRPIGHLSKGFRQRVGLAQAIVHQPKLLILDEPTIGLDPTQIVEVRRLIQRLAQNSTILLSTHILSEVEAVCERVIILMNGEIRADARLDELAATADVVVVLGAGAPQASAELRALPGVRAVETTAATDGAAYRVTAKNGQDLRPAIYDLARERGWPLRELRRDVRTLESVFNELATAPAPDEIESEQVGGEQA